MNIQPPVLTDKKIDRIIKVLKVVVAVGGLEPPTFLWYEWRRFILGTLTTMTTKTLYQLNYTAK